MSRSTQILIVVLVVAAGALALSQWAAPAGDHAGVELTQRSAGHAGDHPVSTARPSSRGSDAGETDAAGYALLVERNIFVRDRRPPSEAVAAPPPKPEESKEEQEERRPPPPRDPGLDYALRGVALQGPRRVAFLERTSDRSYISVHIGDEIAEREVVTIELDYVEFAREVSRAGKDEPGEDENAERETARVTVGCDLTGKVATAVYVPGRALPSSPMTTFTQPTRARGGRGQRGGGGGDDGPGGARPGVGDRRGGSDRDAAREQFLRERLER